MKQLVRALCMGISLATVSVCSLANVDPLIGIWKTVDDQSGYSRADVEIRKNLMAPMKGLLSKPGVYQVPKNKLFAITALASSKVSHSLAYLLFGILNKIQISQMNTSMVKSWILLGARSIKVKHV